MSSKLRYLMVLMLFLSGALGSDRAVDTDVPANIAYLGIINDAVIWDTSQDSPPSVGSVGTGGSVLTAASIALVDADVADAPAELTSSPRASGFHTLSGSGGNDAAASAGAPQATMRPGQGSFPGGNDYATGSGYEPGTQQRDIVSSNSSGTQIAQGANATGQVSGSQGTGFTGSPAPLHQPRGTTSPPQVSNTPGGTISPLPVSNPPGATISPSQMSNPGTRAPDDSFAMDTVGKASDKADEVTGHSGHAAGDAADNGPGSTASPTSLPCDTTSDGAYVFCVDVIANETVFLDPIVAIGYDYAIGNGDPFFATVTLPIGIGDSLYTLEVGGDTFALAGGELFDFRLNGFPEGVAEFEVLGIETGAMLDPLEPTAFVTEVTFTAAGQFTGTMTPITAQVPEPATLSLFGLGLVGLGLFLRRRSNESSRPRFS